MAAIAYYCNAMQCNAMRHFCLRRVCMAQACLVQGKNKPRIRFRLAGFCERVARFAWLIGEGVARLAGIEPTTLGFGGQYSIH